MTVNPSKAISLGYLMKVSAGNVNASHTEGNVVVTKKVTLPDGSTLPYISGQAIRRMLRERLFDLGWQLSEPSITVGKEGVKPPVRPWEFMDEDLFGYLDPSGGIKKRTSPVRVAPLIGAFPFWGERDLGTRSFEKFGQSAYRGGNMFETEIYQNLFIGGLLLELDRIGIYPSRYELIESSKKQDPTSAEKEEQQFEKAKKEELRGQMVEIEDGKEPLKGFRAILSNAERLRRVESILKALNILWGGGRTSRMLADLSPKFLAYARTNVKHPMFIEALTVQYKDSGYHLDLKPVENALHRFAEYTDSVFFGIKPGFLANEDEIKNQLGADRVMSVHEAINKAQGEIRELWKSS